MSDAWNDQSLDTMRKALLEMQARMVASRERDLDDLEKTKRELDDLAQRLAEEHASLVHWREETESSLSELESHMTTIGAQTGSQETLERLEEELRIARDEIAATEARLREESDVAQQRIQALETQLSDKTVALEESQSSAGSASQEFEQLGSRVASAERERDEMRARAEQAEQKAESLRTRAAALEEQADASQQRVRKLESRLGDLQNVANALIRATTSEDEPVHEVAQTQMPDSAPQGKPASSQPPMPPVLEDPLVEPAQGRKRSLGEILCHAGAVTREQVEAALAEQRRTPQMHLGEILVRLGGTDELTVARALAVQGGFEFLRLDQDSIDPSATEMITQRLAQQHCCVPIRVYSEKIVVAMANPLDLVAIEDLERATGRSVDVMVSVPEDIRAAIERFYWEPE